MKKVLLALIGLIVLSAAGLTIYIASIDWNEHKDKIAQQFSEVTGKQIVFEGPVSFKLLPSPYLTASRVKIFNPGAVKDQPLVEMKSLVANLDLVPLLKGNFDVKRMVLEDPQINVEISDDGSLNWQYPLTPEQRNNLETTQIKLNSVSLENATLNFDDPYHDINVKLDNLNGEIIAQSIFGPFRIEGNYIKDNNPEGFAISVGQLSESFATTLNIVFTHPLSKSYVRFDGTFLLSNKVLNGNVIVESEKLRDFALANFKVDTFKKEYDYPLALTFDIAANEQQINLSNMVIKYGETQGAGSMQIPLNDGLQKGDDVIKPRVDMAFNFTDFNLDPVVYTVKDFLAKHQAKDNAYKPDLSFDMLVDLKSLRTVYNNEPVKNFEASFDVIDNALTINKLTATLPGDTDLSLKGNLTILDEDPFYNLDVSFNSSDFLKTLNWVNIKPEFSAASTYRKAVGNAKLSGTLNKIQVSPFSLTMDKSTLSGEAGIKLGERNDIMLVINGDMVNFDNYITPLPTEERSKNWSRRMQYRFSKIGFLNDFDMQITSKLDLGIYENMPYEKVDFKANLLEGKLDIDHLTINSVANAKMDLAGMVSGFGSVPRYENLKYGIKTGDVAALINKFEFKAPNLDYKQLKNFESKGIATGSLDKFAIKAISKLENLDFVYSGQVTKQGDGFIYNGDLEVKHPDFVKMLNSFNVAYNPQTYSLGLFNLNTKFSGTSKQFRANPLTFNIGFNSFSGDVSYDATTEQPSILTSLDINKFEIDRFLNQSKDSSAGANTPLLSAKGDEVSEFLARPKWSAMPANYDFYKTFDLSGRFSITDLSYKDQVLKNAAFDIALGNGNANITNISGKYRDGDLKGTLNLNMNGKPTINISGVLNGIDVATIELSGTRYGLSRGKMVCSANLNGNASSQEDLIKSLGGSLDFNFTDLVIKGWNLPAIYNDISQREVPDGLLTVVKDNLQSGTSNFNEMKGKMTFHEGAYSLSDTSITGSGATIGVFGDGSLPAWDMNVLFNVKYDEPKYLPGLSFALKGPMNVPLLDVNISALYDLYKSRQDKIAAQERAVIEAEENRIQGLVNEQKKAADALLADARETIQPEVEKLSQTAFGPEAVQQYGEVQRQLMNEISEIANNSNKALSISPDEGLIADMAAVNKLETANLERIRLALKDIYLDDQKFKMENLYNQIIENYNQSKMIIFTYNAKVDNLKSRLYAIKTDFKFEDDANIVGWQQFIEDKNKLLNEQNQELLDKFTTLKNSPNIKSIEDYNQQLQELQDMIVEDVKAMDDSAKKFSEYTEQKVKSEEDNYANRLREEEIQRKVEENTGVINIKKTGKSVTVKRDIDEIEKTEELTSQDKVKVLDFSAPRRKNVSGKDSSANPVKKGRVIRN